MNLLLRLLWILFQRRKQPQCGAFDTLRVRSRAFLEHKILDQDNRVAALIVIRGMFWSKKKGGLSPEDLIAATGQGHLESPTLPEWVEAWRQTLDALSAQARKDREIQRELPRDV